MNLISMAKLYRERPSIILGIEDVYTAFCLDEACVYITSKIKNGEEPVFKVKDKNKPKPHYSSLRDMYDSMGFKNGSYKRTLES